MSPIIRLENVEQFAAIKVNEDLGVAGGPKVIPNCVEVTLNWTLSDGKTGHNVLHGQTVGVPSPSVAQANAIFSGLSTSAQYIALKALFPPSHIFSGVSLRSLHSAFQPLVPSSGPAVPGTSSQLVALPNETALVITLRTGLTGPGARGRIYVAGWANDQVITGNVAAAAAVTALNNWAQTIPTTLTGSNMTFCLGRPKRLAYTGSTGTPHPARDADTLPITSQTVLNNTWDSQRRRGLR